MSSPMRLFLGLVRRSQRIALRWANHSISDLTVRSLSIHGTKRLNIQRHQYSSTVQRQPPPTETVTTERKPEERDVRTENIPKSVVGKSGRVYEMEKALQKPVVRGQNRVCLATSEGQKYVLKYVSKETFDYFEDIYRQLEGCSCVRTLHDTIPENCIFVFKFAREDLLSLAQKDLPLHVTKKILKDTLRGLAALHDLHIVHADVKANNVMIDYEDTPDGIVVTRTQLTDIEDGAHAEPDEVLVGSPVGNYMWRSPEAHIGGPIQTPVDMFSFALLCIYAVHRKLLFAVNRDALPEGETVSNQVIEKQLAFFADPDSLRRFMKHLDEDSPWRRVFKDIGSRFGKEHPRTPVSMWNGIDPDLKDLIARLTRFEPEKRISAREALAHKWFEDV